MNKEYRQATELLNALSIYINNAAEDIRTWVLGRDTCFIIGVESPTLPYGSATYYLEPDEEDCFETAVDLCEEICKDTDIGEFRSETDSSTGSTKFFVGPHLIIVR